jgi:hypothetical protein
MPVSRTQRSFTAGEIAPDLYGRADLVSFSKGLATCRNAYVRKYGGVVNRQGSKFIAAVKDSNERAYLAKAIFSNEVTFIIEIGNLYFRFFAQGAVVGAPYELVTPYAQAHLSALKFSQSEDVITITHASYQPRELRRVTDTNWTLTVVTTAPQISAPAGLAWTAGSGSAFSYRYQVTAVRSDDYEESLPAAAVTHSCNQPTVSTPNALSWSAVAGACEYNVYLSRDGNAFGFIGTTTSTTFNDIGFMPRLDEPPPSARSLFTSAGNYPKTSGYIQQRRGFAATTTEPKKTWLSRTGRELNYAVSSPLQDDDAVTFEIKANQLHEVRHILEIAERPLIGTSGGWWFLRGDETGSVVPTLVDPRRLTAHGPAAQPPCIIGDGMIYLQDRGKVLRDLRLAEGVVNEDLTLLVPHLMRQYSIERFDYAALPDSILWAVRSDGTLLSLTYNPEQQITGWGRHDTGDGDLYEDVVVVPEGHEDAVYVLVKRSLPGRLSRTIERFTSRDFTAIATDAIFLDSYLTYNGVPADEISGLGHLEGEDVGVLADGNALTGFTVSGGALSPALPFEASVVHVGLPITTDIETLDLDLAELELRDKKKKLGSVSLLVHSSRGIFAGPDADHLYEYQADFTDYDAPPGLLTGIVEIPIKAEWLAGGRILIRQTDPLPLTILAIVPNADVGG